ncbi:hypothetical protein [Phytoactinopolyspora limicola]|uniref:hypothetical protein n=1 Tax=Phytoactinopolyspora limicola TaxID=2715536 RepID=UPI001FEC80D6|nr:hypothetical protein [Phytoactinopolyspora limicola]
MASVRYDGKKWRARYFDPAGRQREKRFARKVDAQQWLDEQTTQHVTGTFVEPTLGKITVPEWAEKWLATKLSRKASTRNRYEGIVRSRITSAWHGVAIADVVHDGYQEWIAGLSGAGLSAGSVVKIHGVMSQIMSYAVRSRRLIANPCEGVTLPTVAPALKAGPECWAGGRACQRRVTGMVGGHQAADRSVVGWSSTSWPTAGSVGVNSPPFESGTSTQIAAGCSSKSPWPR